ncbi:MAG: flagellar basal body P-ring formation chaperone FlgA, partial [Phycisphaeraceae bacterium]
SNARVRPAPEANPATAITADDPYATAGRTLRHRLHQWITQQVDFGDDVSVTIEFEESDGPLLDAPLGVQRLEFEPLSSHPIGRVPVTVRRYDGDALAATDRLRVQVIIKQPAVIASRSLTRGQVITASDLKVEQITLTSSRKTPLRAVDSAVGKQSVGLIREGAVVYVDDVEAPLLVKRGQAVTVRAVSGGIVLRTVGRAMEDGQQGEMILLRNERTRERFYVHVTGPQEAVMNLDEPDTLAAQENGQ